MKKNLMNILFAFVVISMLTLAYSCSNNDNNPVTSTWATNSINGRITFTDSTGYYKFKDTSAGYFDISAFSKWPPQGPASGSSKLNLSMVNGKMVADYKVIVAADGFYTLTSAYIKLPYTQGSVFGLGKYGSDTSHNGGLIFDTTNARVTILNGNGVGGINFLSWIDTTNKIYKF